MKIVYRAAPASRLLIPWLWLLSLTAGMAGAAESWQPPRTEFGHPDMQGVWYYGSATPMERAPELGNQQSYTLEQGVELVGGLSRAEVEKAQALDPDRDAPEAGELIAQEADHNFATIRTNLVEIDGLYRTSLIISPENGRFPFREGGRDFFEQLLDQGHGAFDGPEIRPASERCAGPNGGPMAPMIGWFYNANMQIYQTADHVVINAEMNHDARIIPLDGDPSPLEFGQWMGRSVAFWDGDTLVVETDRFRPEQSWFAFRMSGQLRVTERFRLLDDDTILYRYTMTDPQIYSAPVTVEKTIIRRPPGEELYEYSCHEGNYSMSAILAGARREELETP